MNNKYISISLFRVSADGQFLDVVIDCPRGYQFTKFTLTANYRENGEDFEDRFDIGDSTFKELAEVTDDGDFKYRFSLKTHWVMRIGIPDQLGISVPAIYTGNFEATHVTLGHKSNSFIDDTIDPEDNWNPDKEGEEIAVHHIMHHMDGGDVISDSAVCSDVSNVYNHILDGVINVTGPCDKVSDDIIRIYLILYAHQEAMRLGHFSDALLYFNMINSNFNRCGNFVRSGSGPSCGCQGSGIVKISSHKSGGASCGCGKK